MKRQKEVYVFDVDGVLTNPYTKIPNQTLIQYIAQKLNKGDYVGVVSGRAMEWVYKKILPEIKKRLSAKEHLDYLFLSGEMGSVTALFEKGELKEHIDTSVILPQDVLEQAKEEVKGKEHLLFVDPDKKTMVTFEMQGGTEEQVTKQTELLNEVNEWLMRAVIPTHPNYQTHISSIALDFLKKGVNKKLSIKKLLAFLKERGIVGETFITFGDSPSDVQMAEALLGLGYPVTFVYVGPKTLEKEYPFPVITPPRGVYFDEGVVQLIENTHLSTP